MDMYQRDLQYWYREDTHDAAVKMDLIVNRLEGAAQQHGHHWLQKHDAEVRCRRWHRLTYGNVQYRNEKAAMDRMACPRVVAPLSHHDRFEGDWGVPSSPNSGSRTNH